MARQIETTPVTVKNLEKWIKENMILVREDGEGKLSRIVASHTVKGKKGEDVFFIDVPRKAREEWCGTAALEIHTRLTAEASNLGGLQRYMLYAYCSGDMGQHVSRYVVRIQGTEDEEDDLLSEAPDRHGLTSQAMRHAEVYAKIQTGSAMTVLSSQERLVSRLMGMVETLLADKLTNIEALEELTGRKHEREVEMTKAQAKAKVMTDLGTKLGMFVPAIMNRVAGQTLFPVQANAVMMMVKGLTTSLVSDEERMAKIMALLKPEEAVAFINIADEVNRSVDDKGMPVDKDHVNGTAPQKE